MVDENTQKLFELADVVPAHSRLIGIDLGSRTIGLALSDVSKTVASPLETLKRTKFKENATVLAQLCQTHNVQGLILGLPLNMDGSEGPRTQATRAYMRNWLQFSPLPMALWDERLSTAAVTRTLLEVDASRQRRSQLVDKLAATYILQGALDRLIAR
jgi:putative pre-16S rRNA nuclease